jgi:hypothetical protein
MLSASWFYVRRAVVVFSDISQIVSFLNICLVLIRLWRAVCLLGWFAIGFGIRLNLRAIL